MSAPGESGARAKEKEAEAAKKPAEINVIAIADLDVISEQFFMLRRQRAENLELDNVTFVLNCVDVLAGDDAFVALRKRRPLHRTLTLLEAKNKTFIEINGNPNRRDLNEGHARLAANAGVKICVNTDAHGVDTLDNIQYGLATARRAWLTKGDIANTRTWAQLLKLRGRKA